ncbi:MAG: 2OG-Fe(II) oxygenase [Acidobacteria bacterium]|nr:2OG-Fe(II) oxygenase [Acidobacteriota bacterium]
MSAFSFEPRFVHAEPFDFIQQEQFLREDLYRELERSFPVCPPSTGPSGFSYYWGDGEYQRLIAENWAWKEFFETAHSQRFVEYCRTQFHRAYQRHRCIIDLSKAVYVPYQESRQDKERRHIRKINLQPHELFVRLDLHQGYIGYRRKIHLDHRRRVATLLIYFCDADESGFDGGDLVLHKRKFRILHPEAARIRPKRNLMAGFACSPVSFHSVPDILRQDSPRNFVQIQLSSQVDAWPS